MIRIEPCFRGTLKIGVRLWNPVSGASCGVERIRDLFLRRKRLLRILKTRFYRPGFLAFSYCIGRCMGRLWVAGKLSVGRHWAIFDIEKLVEKDGDLLHQTLLKTWEKMMGHRLDAMAIKIRSKSTEH